MVVLFDLFELSGGLIVGGFDVCVACRDLGFGIVCFGFL